MSSGAELVNARRLIGGPRSNLMAISPMKHASLEYSSYRHMLDRCFRNNNDAFADYGGRGISVCERWRESFENFLTDMGPRPENKTLDRVDNEGNYEPENCRWATRKEQGNNRRSQRIIEYGGLSLNLTQWAERIGMDRRTFRSRFSRDWTVEKILATPTREYKNE